MKTERYAYVTNGGGENRYQVVVRVRVLHPTKGWRSQREHIKGFDDLAEAMAYAKEINDAK